VKVIDATDEIWLSVYDPLAQNIMRGKSPEDIKPMYD